MLHNPGQCAAKLTEDRSKGVGTESASHVPLFLFHVSAGPGIEDVYNLSQFEALSKVCAVTREADTCFPLEVIGCLLPCLVGTAGTVKSYSLLLLF